MMLNDGHLRIANIIKVWKSILLNKSKCNARLDSF